MGIRLLEKREKENNREYAYRTLRENIMTLELPPGRRSMRMSWLRR